METLTTAPLPVHHADACPDWYTGSPATFQQLYRLRERIHAREARVERQLRHLAMTGLGVLLVGSLVGQYALASPANGGQPMGILLLALLPVFCALLILAVHVLEARLAEMNEDGLYADTLQRHLAQVTDIPEPLEGDPIARLIFEDARQLRTALIEHRPIHPALLGEGLRLGH